MFDRFDAHYRETIDSKAKRIAAEGSAEIFFQLGLFFAGDSAMLRGTAMTWTTEQVLALAPDASSAKSGKDLALPHKWMLLGANDGCAWGLIQGSSKAPYQTSIDLSGPIFKCSCPSRKFPCKHGLGLLLILAQQPAAVGQKTPPAWTAEWLAKRAEREEKKAVRAAVPETPPNPEAAAKAAIAAEKRVTSRESKVTAGLEELGIWIDDLIRSGFATLPGKPSSFWQNPAARLIDAQAPGLARRVSALEGITTAGEQWPARLLRALSLLHLAREGWRRKADLPEAARNDLRAAIGFTANQQEVLAQAGVRDRWLIVGQRLEEEERLRVQRTWLFGAHSKRPALLLSFSAANNQPLDVSLVPGATLDAEMVFFPSAWPLRALVKQRHGVPQSVPPTLLHANIAEALALAAGALAANPWTERVPFAFGAVTPLRRARGWMVRDTGGYVLPLDISDSKAWVIESVSGGAPVPLAGEWDGDVLTPLGVWDEGRYLRL